MVDLIKGHDKFPSRPLFFFTTGIFVVVSVRRMPGTIGWIFSTKLHPVDLDNGSDQIPPSCLSGKLPFCRYIFHGKLPKNGVKEFFKRLSFSKNIPYIPPG